MDIRTCLVHAEPDNGTVIDEATELRSKNVYCAMLKTMEIAKLLYVVSLYMFSEEAGSDLSAAEYSAEWIIAVLGTCVPSATAYCAAAVVW